MMLSRKRSKIHHKHKIKKMETNLKIVQILPVETLQILNRIWPTQTLI